MVYRNIRMKRVERPEPSGLFSGDELLDRVFLTLRKFSG
jgi:hypothetical protein